MAVTTDNWFTTRLVGPRIWAIDDRTQDTIYLVEEPERALLVDTGWGIGDLPALVRSLTDRPVIVVNTHGHPDHVLGDAQFPEVYVPAADLPLAERYFNAGTIDELREGAIRRIAPAGFDLSGWGNGTPHFVPFAEGHVFDLGNRTLRAIALGGHTPGSTCFLDVENRLLLTGDAILVGPIWLQLGDSLPLRSFRDNLVRLSGLADQFDALLPAHRDSPLAKRALDDLIAGLDDILAGRLVGTPEETFAGNGLRCIFPPTGVGVLYRPEHLEA
jgi:glyoxylase-like metal-dependent hydrolase (beta-lactamase superfamily II)